MYRLRVLVLTVLLAVPAWAGPADEHVAEGFKALAARDIVAAMDAFTRALEAEPAHVAAAFERGKLLRLIGEPQSAIADFTTVILADPANGRAYVERAEAKLALKDAPSAIADFDRAIELAPQDVEVHVARAAFRIRIGNIAGAKDDIMNAKAVADEATAQKLQAMLDKLNSR